MVPALQIEAECLAVCEARPGSRGRQRWGPRPASPTSTAGRARDRGRPHSPGARVRGWGAEAGVRVEVRGPGLWPRGHQQYRPQWDHAAAQWPRALIEVRTEFVFDSENKYFVSHGQNDEIYGQVWWVIGHRTNHNLLIIQRNVDISGVIIFCPTWI